MKSLVSCFLFFTFICYNGFYCKEFSVSSNVELNFSNLSDIHSGFLSAVNCSNMILLLNQSCVTFNNMSSCDHSFLVNFTLHFIEQAVSNFHSYLFDF